MAGNTLSKDLVKLSKKEIYAQFGIEYKNGKILCPDGRWHPELLKDGNSKTGIAVKTWSLLPGKGNGGTCPVTCPGCYAMRGRCACSNVVACYRFNTWLVNEHIDFFKRAIMAQLATINATEIRIHAAGDFATKNPAEYTATWHYIADNAISADGKKHIYWTYTKVTEYETLFDDLENANIVKSRIKGIGFNFGHCDHIIRAYEMLKAAGENVYICRCGIDKNQHCEKCGLCSSAKYVLFIEHSTEYVAENDPLFPALKAIIESQKD